MKLNRTFTAMPLLACIALALAALAGAPCRADETAGDALMQKKQYIKAVREYEAALQAAPGNGDLIAKIGRACDTAKWYGQSVRYWEMYAEKHPDGPHAQEARKQAAFAHRWLGVQFYDLGDDIETVERHLRKAVEWDPALVDAHYWLGRILMEKGRFQDAVAALEQAQKADPENKSVAWLLKETKGRLDKGDAAFAHYSQAYTLYEQKKLDEALQQYELAVQANPKFTDAHAWIARIYMEKGQYNRAVDKWNAVLQLEPGNKRAAWFRNQARSKLSGAR